MQQLKRVSGRLGLGTNEMKAANVMLLNADVDECVSNVGVCGGDDYTCVNLPGGYRCECSVGYIYSDVSATCLGS